MLNTPRRGASRCAGGADPHHFHDTTKRSLHRQAEIISGGGTPAVSQTAQREEIRRSHDRDWERQLKRLMEATPSSGQSETKQLL
jgi:hypothetical protein